MAEQQGDAAAAADAATPAAPGASGEQEEGTTAGEPDRIIKRNGGQGRRLSCRKVLTVDCQSHLIEDLIEEKINPEKPVGGAAHRQHPAAAVQTPGMVLSVWGCESSAASKFEPYFSQKAINFDGELSNMQHYVGLMSHRGHKPDMPNQDEFFVLAREETLLFGVLDGHGPEGHVVAHFAQEHLPTMVTERIRSASSAAPEAWRGAVGTAFEELKVKLGQDLQSEAHYSGTTTTLLMLDRDPNSDSAAEPPLEEQEVDARLRRPMRLRCAYLGDSIAVAAKRRSKAEQWEIKLLTIIHRPDRVDEAARIYAMGGHVSTPEPDSPPCATARLCTPEWHLAMSRSMGDFHAVPYGLSGEPEFSEDYQLEAGFEHIILACSDGVWDVIPPAQAVQLVGRYPPSDAQMAVDKLVAKAQLRWQETGDVVDDITALLVWPTSE
jgi:serine/threonine protein phosphatase PrpC